RAVMPLGGARAVPVDVRVVCATHRDLRAMIAAGTFREDLFYRINGLAVTLPPLASRTDLPALVERILARLARSEPMPRRIAPDVLDAFARHRWPGNLRQMTNVLRTAGMLADDEAEIVLAHLPDDFWLDCDAAQEAPQISETPAKPLRRAATLQDHQTAVIDAVLARHRGNVSATARELGLARNTVYRHLRRH
ncbi:sigma 54-interacting transcriptional regulator, partial [Burkholderia ubonensis]|uniref:sigma 54-interacting transcriptional regulator n=1 Tax=Burkholderia ubonensis TaxID=101571 RepID=UPI00016A3616